MAAPVAAIRRVKAFTDAMLAMSATSPFPEFAKPACEAMAEMPLHLLDPERAQQGNGNLTLYTGSTPKLGRHYTLARFALLLMKHAPPHTIKVAFFGKRENAHCMASLGIKCGDLQAEDVMKCNPEQLTLFNGNKMHCMSENLSKLRGISGNIVLVNHAERMHSDFFWGAVVPLVSVANPIWISVLADAEEETSESKEIERVLSLPDSGRIDVSIKIPAHIQGA